MLKKVVDPREAAALARLSRSDDGVVLIALLRESLKITLDNLIYVKLDTAQRIQGQAETINDVADLLEGAQQLLNTLEKRGA